jgi:hypothetical protein
MARHLVASHIIIVTLHGKAAAKKLVSGQRPAATALAYRVARRNELTV